MARKKFIVNGKNFPSENKAYIYVRELYEEWREGRLESSKVNVFICLWPRTAIYERLDFENDFHPTDEGD